MIFSLQTLLGWMGGASRAKLSGGPGNEGAAPGAGNYANRPVTLESALGLSAVWACTRLTAQTVGTLPFTLFERTEGGRRVAGKHPLYALLHDRPNADQTAVEFWEGVTAWVLTWGDAFAEKHFRTDGQVVSLHLLRADLMTVRRDARGALRYRYADPRTGTRDLSEADVLHIRGFGFGGDRGLSAIQFGRHSLGSAMAADEAAGSTFANGMRPSGWFKVNPSTNGGMLTREQRAQAKQVLIDPYTGAGNTAKVGILEGDFSWIPSTLPPDDSQLLESRQFNVEEVCRWFGMPPILIGHASAGQTMWGSGVEQIMLAWLTLSLRSLLRRIQQGVNRSLIRPEERERFYAEHNIEALLQADSAARAEFYSKMLQNAGITPNEMRAKENLPAIEGGDGLLVNSTLIPLDKAGQDRAPASGGGRDAGRPFDEQKAFNPAKHPRDKNGMFAGRGGRGRNIGRMVRRSRADPAHDDVVDLGKVDGARFSEAAGRDVEGWRFGLRSETVRHIHRAHGSASTERTRGQKPITVDDYVSLSRVTGRGAVSAGGLSRGRRLQTVVVEHESRGVRLTAVFEVQPRRKTLALLTMFKK